MRFYSLILFCIVATPSMAKPKHNHKAHDHGHAKLDVAVDGKTISLELEAPGEVIFGFEHKPKSDKDKAIVKTEMTRLNDKVLELFTPPTDAGCTVAEKDVEASQAEVLTEKKGEKEKTDHGDHADVLASYTISCSTDLKGKKLAIGMFKAWKRLKSVKLQVISEAGQKGMTLRADATDIAL